MDCRLLYCPNQSNTGKATIVTNAATTMINSSIAIKELMLPVYQFSRWLGQKTKKMWTWGWALLSKHQSYNWGWFWKRASGDYMNESLTWIEREQEFRSYFLNSFAPLFLDADDVRGKSINKVDRCLSRMEFKLWQRQGLVGLLFTKSTKYC